MTPYTNKKTAPMLASPESGNTQNTLHSTQNPAALPVVSPALQPAPMLIRGQKAAARTLGLKARKIWELCVCNALPHQRCGRAYLFDPAELRAWFDCGCPSEPDAAKRVRVAMRRGRGVKP